jgi:pimeloyl-ACP methyl ester carboxylesterase
VIPKKMSFCPCRAGLSGQNRRWWWLFLITVIGMGIRLPAGPAPVITNYPIEAHYSVAGPWEVSFRTHRDSSGNGYELFYPAHLGTSGFKHPIVTWGNGTYATPGLYGGILNQLASWGFVVIATTNTMTGTGAEMLAGVREMLRLNNSLSSIFYGKLDTNAIGALGHSQGAGGAVRTAVNSNRLIKTAVLIDLPAQVWISKAADAFDPAQLTVPTLFLGGSEDWLVASPKILRDYYNAVPGQAALLILNGADHLVPQHSGGRYLGYLTAWMMCQLQGDHYARGAFAGTPAEANLNTNWSYQAVKNFR